LRAAVSARQQASGEMGKRGMACSSGGLGRSRARGGVIRARRERSAWWMAGGAVFKKFASAAPGGWLVGQCLKNSSIPLVFRKKSLQFRRVLEKNRSNSVKIDRNLFD
jgi:hypothetical protein